VSAWREQVQFDVMTMMSALY